MNALKKLYSCLLYKLIEIFLPNILRERIENLLLEIRMPEHEFEKI